MIDPVEVTTKQLWLRQWRQGDRDPFALMNADDEVMRYFPGTLSRFQSDTWIDYVSDEIDREGWGLWAVQHIHTSAFVGALGLHRVEFDTDFTPAIEIGWRLARRYWGHGFATEAATGVLEVAFDRLGLDEVVSFTVPHNEASRRVMEKIGMMLDPDAEFDHPRVDPDTHPQLVRHVVYRLTQREWQARRSSSV